MPGLNTLGREPIDGRPLYQYRIDPTSLDMLETAINHRLSREDQVIRALAPVAAARFASNYEEGTPSWAHCGEEIERLYRRSGAQFRRLMDASFGRYGIGLVKRPGADLLLETVIGQAGLPSGMLRPNRPLRKILDRLMQDAAVSHGDLLDTGHRLVETAVQKGELRRAYQEAGHLPKLCTDLVTSVIGLTTQARWQGGSLEAIWQVPGWERSLPFRVEEGTAREIVSHLLNVALAATQGSGCSVERILTIQGGEARLSTRAVVASEGIEMPDARRDVLSVYYTVGKDPIGEAMRIRRKEGDRFVQANAIQDLSKTAHNRSVSLAVNVDGEHVQLDCVGGEPLDESSVWVFEPQARAFAYRSLAPVRLRASELLVSAPEGTLPTEGAVAVPQRLLINGVSRSLWKVNAKARFATLEGDDLLVEAGYTGPQAYLDFKGRAAPFRVRGFSAVFVGDPMPRRIGGLSGRIEWRRAGSATWTNASLRNVTGHLQFRLADADDEVLAERRRVLVLPESLQRPRLTHGSVSFRLPPDYTVVGQVPGPDGSYAIEFGEANRVVIGLLSRGTQFDLVFDRPMPASFIDLATGEETSSGTRQVSSIAASRIVANSTLHDHVEVRRATDRWSAFHSVALREGRLSLSDVGDFMEALSFHPRGRTHALKVEFPNGPRIAIEPYRIRRQEGCVIVDGANTDMRVQLRNLAAAAAGQPGLVELQRAGADTWHLPNPEALPGMYLATDPTHQAAPCLVTLGARERTECDGFLDVVEIANEEERCDALLQFYQRIADNPHEGAASTQLDRCLGWLGELQFFLRWLDPFLVLAANTPVALKILVLARLRGHLEAEQGLTWGLSEVPFFWHRVSPEMVRQLMDWSRHQFGEEHVGAVSRLLDDLPLAGRMKSPAALVAAHHPWREAWQAKVADWSSQRNQVFEMRTPALREAARALWQHVSHEKTAAAMRALIKTVPPGVDLDQTYLLAPYELAIAHRYELALDCNLKDDLLFARYMIDPTLFDDAHCTAMVLLESTK